MVATQLEVEQPTAVADPVWSIVAIVASLDCHVTSPARLCVVGLLLNVPIAMNWAASPTVVSVWAPGTIEILTRSWPGCTVAGVTVRLAVPLTGPDDEDMVAVMEVVPELTPVASPAELMLAIPVLLDTHVTELVMSAVVAGCEPRV